MQNGGILVVAGALVAASVLVLSALVAVGVIVMVVYSGVVGILETQDLGP